MIISLFNLFFPKYLRIYNQNFEVICCSALHILWSILSNSIKHLVCMCYISSQLILHYTISVAIGEFPKLAWNMYFIHKWLYISTHINKTIFYIALSSKHIWCSDLRLCQFRCTWTVHPSILICEWLQVRSGPEWNPQDKAAVRSCCWLRVREE